MRDHPRNAFIPRPIGRDEAETYFKFVAEVERGTFVSIFDGRTEYRIAETVSSEVRPGHQGGVYVCDSLLNLLSMGPLPSSSLNIDAPWAVVRLVGWGARMNYDSFGNSKICIDNVIPVQFIPFPASAKVRFLRRCRRMHAEAQRRRQGGVDMRRGGRLALEPTPEETQEIHRDWRRMLVAMEAADG
mmetsp:Transcript_43576/g.116540  ORF Transcript_43576/g.116540 Transcript_43576/m.116540 type:complete len:187 (-) Transcript_43576:41-601(-)